MDIEIPEKYISKAIAQYEADVKKKQAAPARGPKKIIAISRQLGTGGRKIAEAIGEKIGVTVWGKEILDLLASQSGGVYQARMFEALDENSQNIIDSIVGNFFGQIAKDTYLHLLPKAVVLIAQNDAIIIGRGAHLLVPDAFRVRIKASHETRVSNLMKYERLDKKSAEAAIKTTDKQREAFLKELAGKIGIKNYLDEFDLGINMDRFDVEESSSIILHAFNVFQKLRE